MKSNSEEYLDSLLNSAKSNNDNPQSALSRISGKGKDTASALPADGNAGDIGDLVSNSNGNKELAEIGNILDRLDRDELVDDRLSGLLDDIARPTDPRIPKFTIGNQPSDMDVRDPEEIALDEAIADAERMDAEIQSGKFDNAASYSGPEAAPIVDDTEDDDSLLEVAPEVVLPEDNNIEIQKEADSDADQTPEEILTDLLDDSPGNSLVESGAEQEESLSSLLDNMQEESLSDEQEDGSHQEEQEEQESEQTDKLTDDQIDNALDVPSETKTEEKDIDDLSLEDLEAEMDGLLPGVDENSSDISNQEEMDVAAEEPEMGDLLSEMEQLIDTASEEGSADAEDASEQIEVEHAETVSIDESAKEPVQEPSEAEASSEEESKPVNIGEMDDFSLNDIEADMDRLLNGGAGLSTDGEVAADAPADEGDISIPDLDALMNSLANDEVEDIENTAHIDEASGEAEASEMSKEDILDALTEEEYNEASELSLDELASIPERSSEDEAENVSDEEAGDKKKKKKNKEKKEGFFTKLFKTLTDEDEEGSAEGLASLTDENQQVLSELGGEEEKPKKKKKEKKEKKAKEKKPPKEKKPKKEKPPKPKKEKKPKPPKEPGAPEKIMSPKKIAVSAIFAASLGILFCIPAAVLPERISNTRAENAYSHREYTTAYKLLYGKELTEDQSQMYEQSRVLAWAERYLAGYENYEAMNMKEEALDMLLMAMRNKSDLVDEAAKYGVEIQVQSVYDSIESLLSQNYGLSADDIAEINSIKKERDYTIRLMEIVGTLES